LRFNAMSVDLDEPELFEREHEVEPKRFERLHTENFKQENNVNNSMTDVDLSNPEEIRRYLKENMAEGYLSEDEGMNIDEFVNEYARLLEVEKNMDEIVKEAIGVETR